MAHNPPSSHALSPLGEWLNYSMGLLHSLPFDLSLRQMAILLKVYLSATPYTVKALAQELHIGKPPVCRALDTLAKAGLVKRKRSEDDRRIVYIQRTIKGSVFLSDMANTLGKQVTLKN